MKTYLKQSKAGGEGLGARGQGGKGRGGEGLGVGGQGGRGGVRGCSSDCCEIEKSRS